MYTKKYFEIVPYLNKNPEKREGEKKRIDLSKQRLMCVEIKFNVYFKFEFTIQDTILVEKNGLSLKCYAHIK